MKHIAMEALIDFVNQTASRVQRADIEAHLSTGCARCVKSLALWKRVHQAAGAEKSYQPPEATVRAAKAAFAAAELVTRRGGRRRLVEMLFDSFLSPALAGARAASSSSARQVLYRCEPFQVDLQIEGTPHSNRLVVTGQLLDMSREDKAARRVPLLLSNASGIAVRMVTNEFGEFAGVIEDSGHLELSFTGAHDKPIVIALRDTLGRKARGARCN